MAIIKICEGQPSLAVRIVTPGCNGSQLVDYKQIRLVIVAPPRTPCEFPLSPQEFSGCWPAHDVQKWNDSFILPETQPLLIYPAFEVNDDGDIVFLFDSKLWERKGRYIGLVEFLDGTKILELDLDICSQKFVADRISTQSVPCGGDQP